MPSLRVWLAAGSAGALVAFLPSDAFLNTPSAPVGGKIVRHRTSGGKTQLDDFEVRLTVEDIPELSPLDYEVIQVGDSLQTMVEPEDQLTAVQARAIALEAAKSSTVPRSTVLEALRCLNRLSRQAPLEAESAAPAGAIDGVWRLCFCEGDFLQGIQVDEHGYLGRKQQVNVRIDCSGERIVLGSIGLSSSLPKMVHGGLAYTPETRTVVGTFDKEAVGIESLVLHAFLVEQDALGFHTVSQGKEGFLLFHVERSKHAAERLSRHPVGLPSQESKAPEAAMATIVDKKPRQTNMDPKLVSDEGAHEDRRLAIEETGRRTGSFNTFMRYMDTEVASFYFVLVAPSLLRFARQYSPIAASKITAALVVLEEALRHLSQL